MQNITLEPTKLQTVNSTKLNLKFVLLIFSIFVFSNSLFAQTMSNIQPKATNNSSEEFVPDEIIIQFKSSVANSVQSAVSRSSSQTGLPEIDKLNRKYGVSKIIKAFQFKENASNARQQAADKFGLSRTFILKVENNNNIEALLKEYSANDAVEYAEPNGIVQAHDIPSSDPLYAQQWGLKNTGQAVPYGGGPVVGTPGVDINTEPAWDLHTGSNTVTIAILDSGVDYNHPEFAGRIVPGYDFINNDADPMDDQEHGTACAGIAAASGNNGIGIAGVNWNALIMPIKVLASDGNGSWTAIANGITWAADNGADVLSLSLGGSGASITLENAVNYAHSLGSVIVASRGNDNDADAKYPASYPNVIAVGALSPCNERTSPSSCDGETWWGSSYGADLDVMAPGTRIYTTDRLGAAGYSTGDYAPAFNGTSAAAPFVAGIVALIRSYAPTLTNDEIRDVLQTTATDIGTPGFDIETGYGRVNAFAALDFAANATPPEVSITPVNLSFTLDPDQTDNDTFTISNSGGTNALGLYWDIVESPTSSWLTLDKSSGKIANGDNEPITVNINTTGLINGNYQCTLQVNSNDPNNPVKEVIVDLTVNYLPPPDANITPTSLTYSVDIGESITDELTVANNAAPGNLNLHWSASIQGSLPGLSLNVTSGTAAPGTNNKVQLSMNAAGVSDGIYTGSIDFTTNDPSNQLVSVPIELTVVYTPVGSDKLYVFNGSNPASIIRADLDGQNASQPFVGLGRPIDGAVDMVNRKLYFIDWSPDYSIYRADLNGANKEKLYTGDLPTDIALDVPNNHMYFAQQVGSSTYRISRANLDGSNVVTLANIPSWGISGITIVPSQGKIYWANRYDPDHAAGTGIWRANLDLTGQEKLTSGGLTARGLSLDVVNNEMYWYELRDLGGSNYLSVIRKATMDGINGVDILNVQPGDVALDPVGGKIYWTAQGGSYPNLTYDTYRANLDGTNTEALGLWGYRLAIDFTPPDTEPPTITCPTDIVVNNDLGECGAVVNFQVDFDDNLPGTTLDLSSASGSFFPVGTTTVTATATDAAGNTTQCTFDVTVNDTEPPVLEVQDVTYSLDATGNFILYYGSIVQDIVVKNEDNCGIVQGQAGIGISKYLFDCNDIGDNIISVQNNDINGNHSSKEITITITDPLGVCCAGPTAICQDVTIQLDANGNASTTAEAVNNGSTADCGLQSMTLSKTDFTCADIGDNTVTLTVTDINGEVSTCTATVKVEDNVAPTAECKDITVQLDASGNASIIPSNIDNGSSDNCGIASLSVSPSSFDCTNIGDNTVTLTITDVNGNSSQCTATVKVEDNIPPVAECKNITIQLDANGNASITASDMDGGSNDVCGIASLSIDKSSFDCSDISSGDQVWINEFHYDNTGGDTGEFIEVAGTAGVNLSGYSLVLYNGANGNKYGTVALSGTIPDEGSGFGALSFSKSGIQNGGPDGIVLYDGTSVLEFISYEGDFTANDDVAAGMTSTDVGVSEPSSTPVGNSLQRTGNGSSSWTGPSAESPGSLNAGQNITSGVAVTLTVTDTNGNQSSCVATVTVEDNVAPAAECKDITVQLDANGNATITASDVDNGSNDACGIASLSIDKSSFDCSNVGNNTVTLTVTDNNGNTSQCTATVKVEDNVAPTALCKDITVQLDVNGNASIAASDVNNGSNDACGIASLSIDKNSFDCSNVGNNTVTLTVTDNNGNTSQCNATVKVEDNVAPVALCKAVTIKLDDNGNGSITAQDIDNGSNDACGIASLSLNKTAFDCGDLGDNIVTLTVTDNNGNQSTCTATVTVLDNIPPILTVPKDEVAECDKVPAVGIATATDNCDTNVDIVYDGEQREDGDCINNYTLTRTWTATDDSGNSTTLSQTITIQDTTAPTVSGLVENIFDMGCNIDTSTLPDPQSHIYNGDITGKDNCEGDVEIVLDRTEYIENDCKHYVIYYYKAIDVCGNETAIENMSSVTYFWQEDDIQACAPSFARFKDSNTCFIEDTDLETSDWGWTNYFEMPGEYTLELFTGAIDCNINKGDKSGQVTVNYTGDSVTLEYNLYEPYVMSEALVYIGCEKYPVNAKSDYTVDSSYYNYKTGALDHVTNYTVGPIKLFNTEGINIITQAITCLQKCDCSKSVDQGGTYIPDNDTVDCKKGDTLSNSENLIEAAFKAYPVPYRGKVFLEYEFNYDTNINIEIFDVKGALIKRMTNRNYVAGAKTKTEIDMTKYSDQLYFIRLTTNKGSGIKKIVSQ